MIRVTLYLHTHRHAHKYMDKSTYKSIKHIDKHTVIHGYLNICGGIPVTKISLLTLAGFFPQDVWLAWVLRWHREIATTQLLQWKMAFVTVTISKKNISENVLK